MTDTATDWFYGSDFYGNLYGRIEGKATKKFILAESERRPKSRFEFIQQNVEYEKVKSVLEIGCAGGWSLYPFFMDGRKVVGYDYGPALVEAGKKLGMDLRVGKIDDDKNNTDTYDLILMNHVYEHLIHPVEFMKFLQKYLAPGGHIFIEIPDMKELQIGGLVNAHAYYFTKDTFLHYLGVAGFAPIAYQNDKKALSSQAGIFKRAPENFTPVSLSSEYERMKKIIIADDKKLLRRQSLKRFSQAIHVGKAASYIVHLGRKLRKRGPQLKTVFGKK